MAIHFISGKPGGGKSLYALKLVEEELVHGFRPVYTNLPIKVGRLNEYLQQKYPDKSIDLHTRLRILTDDETGKFWLYRPGCVLDALTKKDWEAGLKPDYSKVTDHGVFYVIDEIHNFFNARAWMETGRDVLFYLSQHRKLSDTVLCITQAIANVDKQFRSVSQDYTYLRNLSKESMGLFRLPFVFIRKTYLSPATDTSQPMESGSFRLHAGELPSCYDTAQGVGIHGRGADQAEKRKGIHWLVAVAVVPLILFAIYKFGPQGVAHFFKVSDKVSAKSAKSAPGVVVPSPAPVPQASVSPSPKPLVLDTPPAKPADQVHVTGIVQGFGPAKVFLSDGRELRWGDMALSSIGRDYVIIDGKRIGFR